MAKNIVSVNDVLEEIKSKKNEKGKDIINRFSKKKFEKLLKAMANDPDFETTMANVKSGELVSVDTIQVTKGFRKFCRHIAEKCGVDKIESEKVMTGDFEIDDMEGLYEFFSTAMYLYMKQGNKFSLIPKEDFEGSIYIKRNPKSSKTQESFHPKTRESLGMYTTTKEEYDSIMAKSTCPEYLKKRTKD